MARSPLSIKIEEGLQKAIKKFHIEKEEKTNVVVKAFNEHRGEEFSAKKSRMLYKKSSNRGIRFPIKSKRIPQHTPS